jgi:hypothetical protein
MYYLRITFAPRPLTGFPDSQIGPWFTKNSLERMGSPQLGPWPWRVAVPAGIRRTGSTGGRGKGGEATRDPPRLDLGAWLGEKRLPAGWSSAPGGGGRWSSCSGEAAARWVT